jgi:hypothetical protein
MAMGRGRGGEGIIVHFINRWIAAIASAWNRYIADEYV